MECREKNSLHLQQRPAAADLGRDHTRRRRCHRCQNHLLENSKSLKTGSRGVAVWICKFAGQLERSLEPLKLVVVVVSKNLTSDLLMQKSRERIIILPRTILLMTPMD